MSTHATPAWRRLAARAALVLALPGCSIVSPTPAWELMKAGAQAASLAMAQSPPQASNTVYHLHAAFSDVCIAFNPQTQVPDMVPALQSVLQDRGIQSRVYDNPQAVRQCPVWLEYSAQFEWGKPPLSSEYRKFIQSAQLTLRSEKGRVLSTSEYQPDPFMDRSKWADTRTKMAPVVAALVTGFQN